MKKQTFLLARSVFIPDGPIFQRYDSEREINLSMIDGEERPTVLHTSNLETQSKTFAAPGDDDPDREAEICY